MSRFELEVWTWIHESNLSWQTSPCSGLKLNSYARESSRTHKLTRLAWHATASCWTVTAKVVVKLHIGVCIVSYNLLKLNNALDAGL